MKRTIRILALSILAATPALGQRDEWRLPAETEQDRAFAAWLEERVKAIEARDTGLRADSAEAWERTSRERRRELKEMLGLEPEPPRGDLHPTITGRVTGDGFVVEKLHFQPLPGLYVAGNLYLPEGAATPLPAILYLSGHANPSKDGISPGNKASYQKHGVWFARNGYVCLALDTVQWGEFLGEHHGTYRLGRWWWASRGYTPAGVEAWTAVRALDYLETRPEVDASRFGATGRSGGGAYSWWVAAIDERIRAVVPVAGITTLRDHILHGCVEGHCDCMFMNNTHQWDYDTVAALVAPRPLLISNTDKDDIFPLGGVTDIYRRVRAIYRSLGAEANIGLHISEGPHADSQSLNTGAFAWFNRHLKGMDYDHTFDEAAKPSIDLMQLRVFDRLPEDERTTTIDESFVPRAPVPPVPKTPDEWAGLRDGWKAALEAGCFRDLKDGSGPPPPAALGEGEGSGPVVLRAYAPGAPDTSPLASAGLSPGFSPDSLTGDSRKRNHLRRRLLLAGTSLEALQTEAIVRAVRELRRRHPGAEIGISASGDLAGCALYASLFTEGVRYLDLISLPESHDHGPCLLGIQRILDMPQALAMALERCRISLRDARPEAWTFASETAAALGWKNPLAIDPGLAVAEVTRISAAAPHSAFTSLLRRGGEWFCAFREGSGHIPGTDGTIRILTSRDTRTWETAAVLTEPGIDLRDPKLSLDPDNRIVLTAGGSVYEGGSPSAHGRFVTMQTRAAISSDGRTWSPLKPVCQENEWLWRVTWHNGRGAGFSYPCGPGAGRSLTLWRTTDGLTFTSAGRIPLHRRMKPSEAAIRFLGDGTLLTLARCEPGSATAFFGIKRPDWNEWQWTDTGRPVQGPDFLPLPDGRILYAGRDFPDGSAATVVGWLQNGRAVPVATLPGGGDCSYPSLVPADDGSILMSYYSSHDGPTSIYLARLRVKPD